VTLDGRRSPIGEALDGHLRDLDGGPGLEANSSPRWFRASWFGRDGVHAHDQVLDLVPEVREAATQRGHDGGDAVATGRHPGARRVVDVGRMEELGDEIQAAVVEQLLEVAANDGFG